MLLVSHFNFILLCVYFTRPYTPPYVSHDPDVHILHLDKSYKFIILASDGVWDFLSDEQAVQIVSSVEGQDANHAAELLVHAALETAAKESGEFL
jgi:serine/threonine protein phosphatase PrpC